MTSLFISSGIWFALGSKLSLSSDEQQNEFFNLAAYFLGTLPLSFALIFFGIGG
jgi:hypothetical protein